jgi:hypothetical protein
MLAAGPRRGRVHPECAGGLFGVGQRPGRLAAERQHGEHLQVTQLSRAGEQAGFMAYSDCTP